MGDIQPMEECGCKDGFIKGGTTQCTPDGFAQHLLTNFPSYHTKIP